MVTYVSYDLLVVKVKYKPSTIQDERQIKHLRLSLSNPITLYPFRVKTEKTSRTVT